jgi:hypothetical protein
MTKGGYQTTSKIIRKIIKEDGLDSFEILRIKHFEFPEQALDYETRFLVKVDASNNDKFFNRHNGGKHFNNKGGYRLSENTKRKMMKPKSKETVEKQKIASNNRPKDFYERIVETRRKNNPVWHSNEMGEKIRRKNIERFSDENVREKHSELMKEYYKNNPVSDEIKRKKSETSSGESNPMFGKNHSEETRARMKAAWVERRKKL